LLKLSKDPNLGTTDDPKHLYSGTSFPSTEASMKAGAQEVTAANRYFEFFERINHKILIPMQTMIDYQGMFTCFLGDF
jgi:hypothetical protein